MKAGMDKFSNIKNEELLMLDEVYSELLRLDLKAKMWPAFTRMYRVTLREIHDEILRRMGGSAGGPNC